MSAAVQPSLLPSNNSTMKGTACSAASGGANSNCSMLHEHFRFVVYLWKIHVTPSPPHIPVSAKLVLLSMWSLSGNHLLIFRILPMQGTPHLEGIWKSFCSCLALGYLEKDDNGHLFIHPGTLLSYYRRQSLYRYYFLELNWFCVNVWGFFFFPPPSQEASTISSSSCMFTLWFLILQKMSMREGDRPALRSQVHTHKVLFSAF